MSVSDTNPSLDSSGALPTTNGGSLKDSAVNSKVCIVFRGESLEADRDSNFFTASPLLLTCAGASSAFNTVKNAQITQDLANGISSQIQSQNWYSYIFQGPVATSVKNEATATSNEFSALAGSREPPSHTAANETPLTRKISASPTRFSLTKPDYHSFFYTLLSWKNPRATGATFAATLVLIFAGRYLPILRYTLKLTWMTLGGKTADP